MTSSQALWISCLLLSEKWINNDDKGKDFNEFIHEYTDDPARSKDNASWAGWGLMIHCLHLPVESSIIIISSSQQLRQLLKKLRMMPAFGSCILGGVVWLSVSSCFSPLGSVASSVSAGGRHTCRALQSVVHLRQLHLSFSFGFSPVEQYLERDYSICFSCFWTFLVCVCSSLRDCHLPPWEEIVSFGSRTFRRGPHLHSGRQKSSKRSF